MNLLCMNGENKNLLFLIIFIILMISIGRFIGSFTNPEISTWYTTLDRSILTPPNYVFSIAWTILYAIISICGWLIWHYQPFSKLSIIKILYVAQLILNWSWTPLFFYYHLTGVSLVALVAMDIIVATLILLAYQKMRFVSLLMIPYLSWILFASYLNFYIWKYN